MSNEYKIVSGIDYNRVGFFPEQPWVSDSPQTQGVDYPRGSLLQTDLAFIPVGGSLTNLEFSIEPVRETRGAFGTPRAGGVYSRSMKVSGTLSVEMYSDQMVGQYDVAGVPTDNYLSFLAMAVTDFTPATSSQLKIRQSSDMKSFTLWAREYVDKREFVADGYDHYDYVILGCVINEYDMAANEDGKIEFKITFEALDYHIFDTDGTIMSSSVYDPDTTLENFTSIMGAGATLPTNTFDSMSPMMFYDYDSDLSFQFITETADYDLRDFSIKVVNNLKPIYNKGKRTPKDLPATKQEITGKFSIIADKTAVKQKIKAAAQTNADGSIPMGSMSVKLISPSGNGVQYTFDNTTLTNGIKETINPVDDDVVIVDAEFVVVGDSVEFKLIDSTGAEEIIG